MLSVVCGLGWGRFGWQVATSKDLCELQSLKTKTAETSFG